MKVLALLFALLLVVVNAAFDKDLTGSLRNEFQQSIVLVSANLTLGQWKVKPTPSIVESQNYLPFFEVIGDEGTSGSLRYQTKDGYAHIELYWIDTPSNQTFWTNVGPSPFIGGVGSTKNGSVQYWLHQMCSKISKGKCL